MRVESKLTRRQLAASLASVMPLAGQVPVPQSSKNPEEELQAMRAQLRQLGDQLSKVPVPMSVEPAFQFKA